MSEDGGSVLPVKNIFGSWMAKSGAAALASCIGRMGAIEELLEHGREHHVWEDGNGGVTLLKLVSNSSVTPGVHMRGILSRLTPSVSSENSWPEDESDLVVK
jgi:hypothetical protein